jgi:glycine/D-amino acid oxidase-like deaminating enzyme
MIVSLRPDGWVPLVGSVPQRRRVIIIGATEAGVSAAYHLGESALLLEERTAFFMNLTNAEIRLGISVTGIEIFERRLTTSTGERFIYDKLISTLHLPELQRLISAPPPTRVCSVESWRYWLNGRDVELLDAPTRLSFGDVDAEAAGKRVAEGVRHAMTQKYSRRSSARARSGALFQPKLVPAGGA